MPRAGLFVGIDVGTQGTKAVVLDADAGRIVARAAASYGLIEGLGPGAAEQHPDTWSAAIAEVLGRLFTQVDRRRVRGAGVSGQQHGFVPLDAGLDVIRPAKLWCDTTTAAEARELTGALGRPVPAGFTASKILWLRRHEPASWARLAHVALPHDWVDLQLTGRLTTEAGDASGTGLFDPVARTFDRDAVRAIDPSLEPMLPSLVTPGDPAGFVTGEAAARFGLPAGTVVAAGGGDNMMSAIGAGATEPGIVVASLGTSGTLFTRTNTPVIDPTGAIAPFCDSTGGWLPLLCVMNLTGVTEEVRAASGLGHDALTALAEGVAPGAEGLLLLPFLRGERVPDLPEAAGSLFGIRHGWLRPAVLFRAALEGTTLNLGRGADRMRRLGIRVGALRLIGGAARNRLWRRILAAVFEVPVTVMAEPEAAALGAAIQALWTRARLDGDPRPIAELAAPFVRVDGAAVEPEPDLVATYRELAAVFAERLRTTHGV